MMMEGLRQEDSESFEEHDCLSEPSLQARARGGKTDTTLTFSR